jgi:hypothetical protein
MDIQLQFDRRTRQQTMKRFDPDPSWTRAA